MVMTGCPSSGYTMATMAQGECGFILDILKHCVLILMTLLKTIEYLPGPGITMPP